MNKTGPALTLFEKGFNCTQSLLVAYGCELGLDRDTALKLASPFGGGIGRSGNTCGAIIGAIMIIGLKHGTTDINDKEAEKNIYKLTAKFIEQFKSRLDTNTILCRELIGNEKDPSFSHKIAKKKCLKYIKESAEIIKEII